MIDLNRVTTYHHDKELFKELGLKPFDTTSRERIYCGQVDLEDESYIKVWVEGLPAQFWFFEVYCAESNKTYKLSTGSGALSHYWASIKMMAEDMLVIDEIK